MGTLPSTLAVIPPVTRLQMYFAHCRALLLCCPFTCSWIFDYPLISIECQDWCRHSRYSGSLVAMRMCHNLGFKMNWSLYKLTRSHRSNSCKVKNVPVSQTLEKTREGRVERRLGNLAKYFTVFSKYEEVWDYDLALPDVAKVNFAWKRFSVM